MKHRIDFSNKKDAIKSLSDRIITAEKHIDGIQVDLLELEKPWHKNISVIISVLAFIFSLGTTAVSAYWTYLQDINSNRTLLLSLIQQIRILAERSIEIQIDDKYSCLDKAKGDTNNLCKKYKAKSDLSSIISNAAKVATIQASEIAEDLGNNATASELIFVGNSLFMSGEFYRAKKVALKAAENAKDLTDKSSALGLAATSSFKMNDFLDGRELFKKAIGLIKDCPKTPPIISLISDINIYSGWARAEMDANNVDNALIQLDNALKKVEEIPVYSRGEVLQNTMVTMVMNDARFAKRERHLGQKIKSIPNVTDRASHRQE